MNTAGYWLDYCVSAMQRAGLFFGHGTNNAQDEAAWLVLHVLGAPLDSGFDDWDRVLDENAAHRLQEILRRRIAERIPLAYLIGEARFCGLDFAVTPEVLVPRSPLAELIQERFSPWLNISPGDRVLDMCTGGGCIAIAIAHFLQETRVDAVDVSAAALRVAAAYRRRASGSLADALHRLRLPSYPAKSGHDLYGCLSSILGIKPSLRSLSAAKRRRT